MSRYHIARRRAQCVSPAEHGGGKAAAQRVAMPLLVALRPKHGQSALSRNLSEGRAGQRPVDHHDHHLVTRGNRLLRPAEVDLCRHTVLTCDGAGDGVCATVCMNSVVTEMRELRRDPWEDSLGALYSWVTFVLGFVPLEHEYKLMGMAPYASCERGREGGRDVRIATSGFASDGLSSSGMTPQRTNDLGDRIFADMRGKRFDHICAGLAEVHRGSPPANGRRTRSQPRASQRVLAAGGVFMNVKANKRIAEAPKVDVVRGLPVMRRRNDPVGCLLAGGGQAVGERFVGAALALLSRRRSRPGGDGARRCGRRASKYRAARATWPRGRRGPARRRASGGAVLRGGWSSAPVPSAIGRFSPIRRTRTSSASSTRWSRSETFGCPLRR